MLIGSLRNVGRWIPWMMAGLSCRCTFKIYSIGTSGKCGPYARPSCPGWRVPDDTE